MGVEEELLLVDPETGALRPVSRRALAEHQERVGVAADDDSEFGAEAGMDHELFLEQLETGTAPCLTAAELRAELVSCRRAAATSAEAAGAALVAVGTPVLQREDEPKVTPQPRYERIVEEFGEIGRQGAVCGMHVHVDVADDDEGVKVIDGLRPWLPVLRAISVNSPFWQGRDTGYASWRSQVWGRWPSAGPSDEFGSPAGYRDAAAALVRSGAALDLGMLYFDARLSEHYPTVELRVCDVMTEVDDVLLVAMLSRALVTTLAAADGSDHTRPKPWRGELLRAAHWRASRYGLSADLLDPLSGEPQSSRAVVETLIEHVHDALVSTEEQAAVSQRFEALVARGTGASRQRAAAERGGIEAVVADLRDRFAASCAD